MASLSAAYSLRLEGCGGGLQAHGRTVAVGCFDPSFPGRWALAVAAQGGRVLLHRPTAAAGDVATLSFGREVGEGSG